MILSIFQTASGEWHIPSILTAFSWFLGFVVTGFFLFSQLVANRDERVKSFKKERAQITELENAKAKINELELKMRPRPFKERLSSLLNEINPKIVDELKRGRTTFKLHVTQAQQVEFQKLCAERDSVSYIHIDPLEDTDMMIGGGPSGMVYGINITLNPELLTQPN